MTPRRRLQRLDILFVANEGETKVNASNVSRRMREERQTLILRDEVNCEPFEFEHQLQGEE